MVHYTKKRHKNKVLTDLQALFGQFGIYGKSKYRYNESRKTGER